MCFAAQERLCQFAPCFVHTFVYGDLCQQLPLARLQEISQFASSLAAGGERLLTRPYATSDCTVWNAATSLGLKFITTAALSLCKWQE